MFKQTLTRRSIYYKQSWAAPKSDLTFGKRIKVLIEEEPSFGYRSVANFLTSNKNTTQRILQIKGWQVRNWPFGLRRRIEAIPSVSPSQNERRVTNLCRLWPRRDDWLTLTLVIE